MFPSPEILMNLIGSKISIKAAQESEDFSTTGKSSVWIMRFNWILSFNWTSIFTQVKKLLLSFHKYISDTVHRGIKHRSSRTKETKQSSLWADDIQQELTFVMDPSQIKWVKKTNTCWWLSYKNALYFGRYLEKDLCCIRNVDHSFAVYFRITAVLYSLFDTFWT